MTALLLWFTHYVMAGLRCTIVESMREPTTPRQHGFLCACSRQGRLESRDVAWAAEWGGGDCSGRDANAKRSGRNHARERQAKTISVPTTNLATLCDCEDVPSLGALSAADRVTLRLAIECSSHLLCHNLYLASINKSVLT